MMLYKNTKVKIRSPDGDTDYFDIVAGVMQGDTLDPFLFICLNYVLRTSIDLMKEISFKLAKCYLAIYTNMAKCEMGEMDIECSLR